MESTARGPTGTGGAGAAVRRRRRGEATRRRVLDAVVRTVAEVGYYKASSNEIARQAGVTWGAIQHLFGSREEMMLEVVRDLRARFERQLGEARIEGSTLEERLCGVLAVLGEHYEDPAYLVQLQILLDLSVNPGMSARDRDAIRRTLVPETNAAAQALFAQALGPAANEADLVAYTFATLQSYLAAQPIARIAAELPDTARTRSLLVRGRGCADPRRDGAPGSPECGRRHTDIGAGWARLSRGSKGPTHPARQLVASTQPRRRSNPLAAPSAAQYLPTLRLMPPATTRVSPTTYPARSEARKATASAMSMGLPART